MKTTASWKRTALGAVTLVAAATLAACGSSNKSASAPSVYSYVYTGDPETLDYTVANRNTTGDIVANLVDGLLENDKYGNLVPSLAEDWTVSEDGLTYTYTIREDAKWFTADGEEYADITAEDFVTGLKHAVDNDSEALYVIENSIAGLADYASGASTDFSTVGVKAIDEKTVQYTLVAPEPYWNSKMTMGILFPINAEFLESQGENFGTPQPDSILYSGPYLLTALTAKSAVEFEKNPNYWDAEDVHIETIKWTYYDGSDPESLAKNYLDGTYTAARVYPTSASYADLKKEHGDEITYSPQLDTVYYVLPNLARTNYTHTAKSSDAEKTSTTKALNNKDFRQALAFSINRAKYTAQNVGEDAATKSVRNLAIAADFVSVEGKSFAEVVNTQIESYGDEWKGVDLSDAQDGLYNADKAKEEFAKAKKALEADGVTFPIHLDVLNDQSAEINGQQLASLKESVESTLGAENVVIDIHQVDEDTYMNATYSATAPEAADYDFSIGGWGPDYADPSTYLDIFGSTVNFFGPRFGYAAEGNAALAKSTGLDKYDELLAAAAAETSDLTKRYTTYAEAQAWLTDSALVIPIYSQGGVPRFTKIVPFSGYTGHLGLKGDVYYKNVELQAESVTAEQFEKAQAKYEEEKSKSNAEYQEKLAEHVK